MLLQCIFNVKLTLTGPRWGRYFVGPIQFALCYGVVVTCTLLGGQCMKVILNSCNTHTNRDPHSNNRLEKV